MTLAQLEPSAKAPWTRTMFFTGSAGPAAGAGTAPNESANAAMVMHSFVVVLMVSFLRDLKRERWYRPTPSCSGCVRVPDVHVAAPGAVLLLPQHDVLRRRPLAARKGEHGASDRVYPVAQRLQIERRQLHPPHAHLWRRRGRSPELRDPVPALHDLGSGRQDAGIPGVDLPRRARGVAAVVPILEAMVRLVDPAPERFGVAGGHAPGVAGKGEHKWTRRKRGCRSAEKD